MAQDVAAIGGASLQEPRTEIASRPSSAAGGARPRIGSMLGSSVDAANLGLPSRLDGEVHELWTGALVNTRRVERQSDQARGVTAGSSFLYLTLRPHGAALLRYEDSR